MACELLQKHASIDRPGARMSDRRLADPKKRVAELQADIDALEGKSPAPVSSREDRGVSVSHPAPSVTLPSDDEYDRLLAIVTGKYKQLACSRDVDPADFAAQFRAASMFAAHHGRRNDLDMQRDLSWWFDNCRHWCREHAVQPSWMTGAALTAAVVAQADILFSPLDHFPLEVRFGLQFAGGGSATSDWWRRALTGTLLPPAELPFPINERQSARRIVVGGR